MEERNSATQKKRNLEMSLVGHVKELRKVLLISLYAIAIGTVIGYIFSDYVYGFLAEPVTEMAGVSFITTTPMEPIMVKLQISVVTGIIIALPVVLWQIWSFILPGLKKMNVSIFTISLRHRLFFLLPAPLLPTILFCRSV